MANPATANEPSAEDVQAAVDAIERLDADLLAEKMAYMSRCKGIRNQKAGEYDQAADQGISKKLLRTKIKERALERRIDDLTVSSRTTSATNIRCCRKNWASSAIRRWSPRRWHGLTERALTHR